MTKLSEKRLTNATSWIATTPTAMKKALTSSVMPTSPTASLIPLLLILMAIKDRLRLIIKPSNVRLKLITVDVSRIKWKPISTVSPTRSKTACSPGKACQTCPAYVDIALAGSSSKQTVIKTAVNLMLFSFLTLQPTLASNRASPLLAMNTAAMNAVPIKLWTSRPPPMCLSVVLPAARFSTMGNSLNIRIINSYRSLLQT